MTCNCEIEVCEKLKEVNEFYSVELELNFFKKRPFTNFLVVERKGNKKRTHSYAMQILSFLWS